MIQDFIEFAINGIRHRKLRSWLTILGIVIGVGAIIALISITQGLQGSIEEQFETFGANRIFIAPKGFQGPGSQSEGLTKEDVETVEGVGDFEYVTPFLFRTEEIEFKNEVKFTTVFGMEAENLEKFFGDVDVETTEGRFIRGGEKFVALLGSRVPTDIFDKEVRIRNTIKVASEDFKVIGILESQGNAQDDNSITIPLDIAREIFDEPDDVDGMMAQVKSGLSIETVQKRIERRLEQARDDENFQVLTASQIAEQITQILGVFQIVLVGIAGISLVVGGIGIMNSMYTSVLERTREIGIMKAIGAKNSDILYIFLIESGIIGLIGGVFGVALGIGIAFLVEKIAAQAGFSFLQISASPFLIIFGLLFAVMVGILSGTLPAVQASKLRPVEALRYE